MDYKVASEKIRAFAKTLAEAGIEDVDKDNGLTVGRLTVVSLQLAWADSIRDQWDGFCANNPDLKAQMVVAEQLMKDDNYTEDPICMPPGMEPMIAMIDGKKAISLEHSMAGAMPLSAIFANKVAEVMSATARVAAAAKQAEPKPDAGPAEETAATVR